MKQLLNNLIVHCDFYSCAPWLWFFNIPKLQILFALDPDFTGNSLLLYIYFTLILIACYCKFDSHSFENANQTHFMWLLQVWTSVYVSMWVFIVRSNASLWQIWEIFLLGVGDMCTRRGVKEPNPVTGPLTGSITARTSRVTGFLDLYRDEVCQRWIRDCGWVTKECGWIDCTVTSVVCDTAGMTDIISIDH